jgi:hypothetical protein
MYGVISAAAALLIFIGLYAAGVVEARADLFRGRFWDDPARRLPRARVWRQR